MQGLNVKSAGLKHRVRVGFHGEGRCGRCCPTRVGAGDNGGCLKVRAAFWALRVGPLGDGMDESWPPQEPEFSFQDVFGVDHLTPAEGDCSLLWNTSLDAAPAEPLFVPSGAPDSLPEAIRAWQRSSRKPPRLLIANLETGAVVEGFLALFRDGACLRSSFCLRVTAVPVPMGALSCPAS